MFGSSEWQMLFKRSKNVTFWQVIQWFFLALPSNYQAVLNCKKPGKPVTPCSRKKCDSILKDDMYYCLALSRTALVHFLKQRGQKGMPHSLLSMIEMHTSLDFPNRLGALSGDRESGYSVI